MRVKTHPPGKAAAVFERRIEQKTPALRRAEERSRAGEYRGFAVAYEVWVRPWLMRMRGGL